MNDKDMHNNVDALLGHLSIEKPSVHVVKKSRRGFYNFILLLAACLSIGFCLVMPVWSDKTGIAIIQDWISSSNESPLYPLGDDPPLNNTSSAYHYEYFTPPADSFGLGKTTFKTPNWSYWTNWVNNSIDCTLEKSPDGEGHWENCTKLLSVDKVWNETNISVKFTYRWVSDSDSFYRVSYKLNDKSGLDSYCDESAKNNSDRYLLNCSVTANESYNCYYDWSDYKNSAEFSKSTFTKQIKSNSISSKPEFIWSVTTDNVIKKGDKYEIDPLFGFQGPGGTSTNIEGYIIGGWGEVGATGGTVDNITIRVRETATGGYDMKCALYEYVDYSSSYAGSLIASTEQKNVDVGSSFTLVTFDFASPPSVTANTKYYLMTWAGYESGYCYLDYAGTSGYDIYYASGYTGTFPDPLTDEGTSSVRRIIYASYTESAGNTAPTQSLQKIWNSTTSTEKSLNATGVSLTPTCFNVTIADTDSDYMNVTIKTNESGSWTTVNATTSGMTDGIYHGYNTSWVDSYNTKYWISFNVSDDSEWCNETYWFWSYNRTNQQLGDYWFLGGNVSSNNQLGNYWFLGNNISDNNQLGDYWFQGGNISSNNQIANYWFLGGNVSSNNQLGNFWFLGGNTSAKSNQQLGNYWFLGGNTSSNNQLGNFWFLGGNTSNNNQLGDYWFLGGNTTARINKQLGNFWFLGGNETDNNQLGNFWFLGGNETTLLDVYDEYPSNESNVFVLQPTIRFSLTNPTGDPMNYTIYTGNSTANCTHYLDNISSVNNGTYHYVNYYNATNYTIPYYWRVYAEDGTQYVNETFHFTPSMQGGHVISSQGAGVAVAAIGMLTGVIALVFAINKRKKRSE